MAVAQNGKAAVNRPAGVITKKGGPEGPPFVFR